MSCSGRSGEPTFVLQQEGDDSQPCKGSFRTNPVSAALHLGEFRTSLSPVGQRMLGPVMGKAFL